MKRFLGKISAIFLFAASLFAQTAQTQVLPYKQDFVRGSIVEKNEVLKKTSGLPIAEISTLYTDALDFALKNQPLLGNDPDLLVLAGTAVTLLGAFPPDQAVVPLLWKVFEVFAGTPVQKEVLLTVQKGKYTDPVTIRTLNAYVKKQTDLVKTGAKVDIPLVSAAVTVLGSAAESASFDVLFQALLAPFPEQVSAAVETAINRIQRDYFVLVSNYITESKGVRTSLAAFRLAMKNTSLSEKNYGELSQKALSVSINISTDTENATLVKQLQREAIEAIGKFVWTPAAPLVLKTFYTAQGEYKDKQIDSDHFVSIINCLGVMQTPDASQALAIYLGVLNSSAEQFASYDEPVVLAVISALGKLGDKMAFDNLLYVSYITNYSNTIISASRDALARLKWQ